MKKILALALVLMMVLSLAACGSVNDTPTPSDGSTDPGTSQQEPNNSTDDGGDGADIGEINDAMGDVLGGDFNGYPFPKVASQTEWPGAEIWEGMGLPDMAPAKLENGKIYNDGSIYIEGYLNAFTAQCDSDQESFDALADMLWEKGYRGMDAGNMIIVEARTPKQLMEDDSSHLCYRAYYEYKGDILRVELQKNLYDDSLYVGSAYAASDPYITILPETTWPTAEVKALIGVDLPIPDGPLSGKLSDDNSSGSFYISGVSEDDYNAYLNNLKNGGVAGLIADEYGDFNESIGEEYEITYYTYIFYPEDYETYPTAIYIGYIEGVVCIRFEKI